jgi:hypothetical protein
MTIRFEQFELDDVREALNQLEYRENTPLFSDTELPLRWFLERVVDIVDKNRARIERIRLTDNSSVAHNPSRSTIT